MGKKYGFSGLNSAPKIFLEGERGEMSTLPEFVLAWVQIQIKDFLDEIRLYIINSQPQNSTCIWQIEKKELAWLIFQQQSLIADGQKCFLSTSKLKILFTTNMSIKQHEYSKQQFGNKNIKFFKK